jgi:hypothetical protein
MSATAPRMPLNPNAIPAHRPLMTPINDNPVPLLEVKIDERSTRWPDYHVGVMVRVPPDCASEDEMLVALGYTEGTCQVCLRAELVPRSF